LVRRKRGSGGLPSADPVIFDTPENLKFPKNPSRPVPRAIKEKVGHPQPLRTANSPLQTAKFLKKAVKEKKGKYFMLV
jgi:hypothetical protein